MPYKKILAALDGSEFSEMAMEAALALAEKENSSELIGCHVYAARLHRMRFKDMESELPGDFKGNKLDELRKTHEDLISEGLQQISRAYLGPLAEKAYSRGIEFRSLTPEGRNYIEILRTAEENAPDLVSIGAKGQGNAPSLGSTAERVLLYQEHGDVLVVRQPWRLDGGRIAVAIDGSNNSFAALMRAIEISTCYGDVDVTAISIYDPFFHTEVFKNISSFLSEQAKEHFDLEAQEKVHNQVIDKGLERLYGRGLNDVVNYAESLGLNINTKVLTGKVWSEIIEYVLEEDINLLVLGRWGLHRERESLIGSNALNLARLVNANVLVVSTPSMEEGRHNKNGFQTAIGEGNEMESDKIGSFERPLNSLMGQRDFPEAEIIVFNKINKFAPNFHRHMLAGKIAGRILSVGDRIMIYRVAETHPSGSVMITDRTRVEVR